MRAVVPSYPFSAFVLCLVCIIIHGAVTAQAPSTSARYYAQHFGEDEGLQQNSINSFIPDRNGFLWIATESGIARFNGNRFLPVYAKVPSGNLNFSRIKHFYYGEGDTILAHASAASLVAVIVKNRIVAFQKRDIRKQGLFFLSSHKAIPAPAYLKADRNGVYRQKWNFDRGAVDGTLYNRDTFVVTLYNGVAFYDSKGLIKEIKLKEGNMHRLVYADNRVLYVDNDNYVNFYTPDGLQQRSLLPLKGKKISRIVTNSLGKGFFCVADSVLYRVNISAQGAATLTALVTDFKEAEGISIIFERDSSTIIVGTTTKGMYVYKKTKFNVSEPTGGENDVIYSQQLLPDQTIFTARNKLFRGTKFIGNIKRPYTDNIYSALKDRKGYYWYLNKTFLIKTRTPGTHEDTVYRFGGIQGILTEDKQGRIWFSSGEVFGFAENDVFHPIRTKEIIAADISCIEQDDTGLYYIGTRNNGLFTLRDVHAPRIAHLPQFDKLDIRFILPEQNGAIWVCTYGKGIFYKLKDHVIHLPEKNGLLSYVHSIIESGTGYLWMPSNNGLFVVNKQALLTYVNDHDKVPFFYRYSKVDGLRTNEFNGGMMPAYLRLPDGQISLSSMHGLVQFDPRVINTAFSATPISIDYIQTDSSEIAVTDHLSIPNSVQNIRFSISNSFWDEKENELLEYALTKEGESNSDKWIPVEASGIIQLFSPAHGSYKLTMRKRTGLHEDDFVYKIVTLDVSPKWYQTTAFGVTAYLLTIAFMLAVAYWRRRSYRLTNKVLQEKVTEATRELKEVNNSLERKVSERTIAIREAERRFRTLVEGALVGVYIIEESRLVYVNPRFEQILGYDKGELSGAAISKIFEPGSEKIQELLNRFDAANKDFHLEVKAIRKDGSATALEIFGSQNMQEGRRTVIGTMIDINERLAYTQSLEEMLFITSHEVRKPVVNLLALTTLASMGETSADETTKYWQHVKLSAEQLDDFTRKLTEFITKLKAKHTGGGS